MQHPNIVAYRDSFVDQSGLVVVLATQLTSIFEGQPFQNKGLFQSKQGSVIWVLGIYIYTIYFPTFTIKINQN